MDALHPQQVRERSKGNPVAGNHVQIVVHAVQMCDSSNASEHVTIAVVVPPNVAVHIPQLLNGLELDDSANRAAGRAHSLRRGADRQNPAPSAEVSEHVVEVGHDGLEGVDDHGATGLVELDAQQTVAEEVGTGELVDGREGGAEVLRSVSEACATGICSMIYVELNMPVRDSLVDTGAEAIGLRGRGHTVLTSDSSSADPVHRELLHQRLRHAGIVVLEGQAT